MRKLGRRRQFWSRRRAHGGGGGPPPRSIVRGTDGRPCQIFSGASARRLRASVPGEPCRHGPFRRRNAGRRRAHNPHSRRSAGSCRPTLPPPPPRPFRRAVHRRNSPRFFTTFLFPPRSGKVVAELLRVRGVEQPDGRNGFRRMVVAPGGARFVPRRSPPPMSRPTTACVRGFTIAIDVRER